MAAVQSNTPHGAQTQVQQVASNFTPTAPRQAVLHLRGATTETEEIELGEGSDPRTRRRIQWAEDVVDNEGLGRKKSKVCCIYHAPKPIDESSDESSSDSDDSDSDSGDDGSARPARRVGGGDGHGHNNDHNHDHDHDHGHGHDHGKPAKKGKGRVRSPNAYEKQPKPKSRGTEKS